MSSRHTGSSDTRPQPSNPPPSSSSNRPSSSRASSPSRARPTSSSRPTREPDRSKWASTKSRPTSAEVLVVHPSPTKPPDNDSKPRYPSRMPYDMEPHSHRDKDATLNRPVGIRLSCWHCLMMFANVVMMAGGLSVFILGAWAIFDNTFTGRFIGANLYLVTVYVLLGCGFFSVCLAVIGCVGAVKAVKCLIVMYMIIAVAIVLTMLVGALSILIFRKWVKQITEDYMKSLLHTYSVNSVMRDAWDTTQQYLHCCGVNSSADWPPEEVPQSCCDGNRCLSKEDVYKAGCLEETENFFDLHVYNFVAVFVGVQLVLLFGLITSCGYYKALLRYGT